MCRLQFITVVGLALAGPVLATPPAPGAPATAASLPKVQQRLRRNQGEVKRLEREVARQESDSKHAGERLQQQDKEIAELRRKLLELQASHPAGQ